MSLVVAVKKCTSTTLEMAGADAGTVKLSSKGRKKWEFVAADDVQIERPPPSSGATCRENVGRCLLLLLLLLLLVVVLLVTAVVFWIGFGLEFE